ncbi:MAG: hypothetical protein BWZ10_02905 [candidate division BRC1 bacterium ADurb.BinA364]|nr:MAG: hypothetical protein BWZ10_02905 [candidate division BRC1 bacterium ADurb.BinA364]
MIHADGLEPTEQSAKAGYAPFMISIRAPNAAGSLALSRAIKSSRPLVACQIDSDRLT